MRRVFTITGNLLAETAAVFDMPERGQTARAIGESLFSVGGKGVNVARAAIAIGMPATAAIFPAGYGGGRCVDALRAENIPLILSEIDGETRTGLVCVDNKSGTKTTFLGSDLPVPESALDDVLARISEAANAGDILAFCGSFPAWKPSYAEKIAALIREKNLLFCLDTYGRPLADLAKCGCDILKVNRAELFSRNLVPPVAESAFGKLHYISLVDQSHALAPLFYGVFDSSADKARRALLRNGLDADSARLRKAYFCEPRRKFGFQKCFKLFSIIRASGKFNPRVNILRILAEYDHID